MIDYLVIIQARMGSTRFPGKVLKTICGKTILDIQINRISNANIQKLVVAIPTGEENDILEDHLKNNSIDVERGSEDDVLDRYYQTAIKSSPKRVIRITSDNPLIDGELVNELIEFHETSGVDYSTNIHAGYPYGQVAEIFSFEALEKAWKNSTKPNHREHVTSYFLDEIDHSISVGFFKSDEQLSSLRLTVDTPEDFKQVEELITQIGFDKPWREYSNLLNH